MGTLNWAAPTHFTSSAVEAARRAVRGLDCFTRFIRRRDAPPAAVSLHRTAFNTERRRLGAGDREATGEIQAPIWGGICWRNLRCVGPASAASIPATEQSNAFVPAFPKPAFDFPYEAAAEIAALRDYRQTKPGRAVPAKAANRLLLAAWNIANLGVQQRRRQDYQLLAEILRWFALAAGQEVNQNRAGLEAILNELPATYRTIFSDAAGNNERMTFLYDSAKAKPTELVGEVAIPPAELKDVHLPGVTRPFAGFDRNPYLAAFQAGTFRFTLVNVHLYFGDDSERASIERRSLEAFALARWADREVKSKYAYTQDIITLGDFNLPKAEAGNPVFAALPNRGLHLPKDP